MRLALLSDVHAKLPAPPAVLDDIEGRRVDGVYHLSDLAGYGPRPNEVVALVAARRLAGVSGNCDSRVASRSGSTWWPSMTRR
jgi:predicted phosphodiesterase